MERPGPAPKPSAAESRNVSPKLKKKLGGPTLKTKTHKSTSVQKPIRTMHSEPVTQRLAARPRLRSAHPTPAAEAVASVNPGFRV